MLTTLVSCRQPQAAQSTLQQHITAAKSCDDKPHNLQHFTSYVLVVPGIFGLQTDAVGALPCLQLLLANPTEGLSPFREHMDVWITARTLLCVLATGKQQSSNAAELSGSILHMLLSCSPTLTHKVLVVHPWCVLYNNTVSIHMKIDPSSVKPLSLLCFRNLQRRDHQVALKPMSLTQKQTKVEYALSCCILGCSCIAICKLDGSQQRKQPTLTGAVFLLLPWCRCLALATSVT